MAFQNFASSYAWKDDKSALKYTILEILSRRGENLDKKANVNANVEKLKPIEKLFTASKNSGHRPTIYPISTGRAERVWPTEEESKRYCVIRRPVTLSDKSCLAATRTR